MLDNATIKKLKEKGVDASVILDLLLEEEPAASPEKPEPTPAEPAAPEPEKAPAAAPEKPEPTPAEPAAPEPEKAPAAAPDPILAAIEKLTGTVAGMQAAIQASNLKGKYVESPAGETTDDILKGLFTKRNKEV